MSNIIDSIRLSGVTYGIKGSGGTQTIELTQAQYDALVDKDPNTFYVITDAEAGDLTNYYTKSETNTLLGGKQATLESGTNIKTINNESILGSGNIDIQGGSTYTAGRGISLSNNAISVSLPISAGTGTNSIKCGETSQASGSDSFAIGGSGVKASGQYSFAGGSYSEAKQIFSMAFGRYSITNNYGEVALGFFNKSNGSSSAVGNSSGNTLFSVGNGTNSTTSTRHNAFEIRQNGDIYLSLNGQDVKLQDQLGGGGGGGVNIVQTTGTSTADVMSQDAVTTQLNNKANKTAAFGGYKFGSINNTDYLQYTNANNDNIGNSIYYPKINGKGILTTNSTWAQNNYNFQLVETSAITTSISSSSTDAQVPSAKAVNDKLGGLSLVKLTQAEYDALATKDSNTLYLIVN